MRGPVTGASEANIDATLTLVLLLDEREVEESLNFEYPPSFTLFSVDVIIQECGASLVISLLPSPLSEEVGGAF